MYGGMLSGPWAKLATARANGTEVVRARALYLHMDAQIVENGFTLETVQLQQGIPQGGPSSGKIYAFFNSDLTTATTRCGCGNSHRRRRAHMFDLLGRHDDPFNNGKRSSPSADRP